MSFITEANYNKHKEAHGRDILRLSVYERSIGKEIRSLIDLRGVRARGIDIEKVGELFSEVELHKVFFSSFAVRRNIPSSRVRRAFGSESALLSEIYSAARAIRCGFVALLTEREKLRVIASESASEILSQGLPRLAVDLWEHAYYGDYGFDREGYLKAALPHLDLSRLDEDGK